MEAAFVFRISDYDAPELETETAALLHQRLEARSREVMPGMWKAADKLNARAAGGQGGEKRRRQYRIYGVLLLALGVFVLVPGLMEPRVPALIGAGVFAILAGAAEFCLAGAKRTLAPPASCRKEAAEFLRIRRETDWEKLRAEVRFDETGWTATTAEGESRTSCDRLQGVFETEHLWMLVTEGEMALLLQKKDLITGAAADFLPRLREMIDKNHLS